MADNALWVAVLTGGTAVAASWVTSRGNARAARIQAEASAQAQQFSRVREVRRTAYLEFIEQAHITGELHWRLGDIYAQLADPHERLLRLNQLRDKLRDAFDPLTRCARTISLEGPAPLQRGLRQSGGPPPTLTVPCGCCPRARTAPPSASTKPTERSVVSWRGSSRLPARQSRTSTEQAQPAVPRGESQTGNLMQLRSVTEV